jgi:uroporphyrinogen decarboxylase
MKKETMTAKERWLAILKRQKPDRIPMDIWATNEVMEKLLKFTKCVTQEDLFKKLHIDRPFYVGPEYIGPKLEKGTDMWGIKYKNVEYGSGSYGEASFHPLANYETVAEVEKNYKWPSADMFDYNGIKKQVDSQNERIIQGGGSEPYLIYKWLRGDENAFIDMAANPDLCHYIVTKIYDFEYENTKRVLEAGKGKIKLSYVAEDLGGQSDLMYSPTHIREYFEPHMRRMTKLVHDAGAYAFHHSDGAIRKIIPDLIEVGMDILNPIQWRCNGMEREGLKKDFGEKLIFHGGVDNQQTIPFGTTKDVKEEVKYNIEVLGKNGGYNLAPCHNIQPVTPNENIVALYEAGLEYGWY